MVADRERKVMIDAPTLHRYKVATHDVEDVAELSRNTAELYFANVDTK